MNDPVFDTIRNYIVKERKLFLKFPTCSQDIANVCIQAQKLENIPGFTAETFSCDTHFLFWSMVCIVLTLKSSMFGGLM